MGLRDELGTAVRSLTVLGTPPDVPAPTLVGALAFYPAVGIALGALAACVAGAVASVAPAAGGAAGVAVLAALEGARGPLGLAAVASALLRPGAPASALVHLRAEPPPSAIVVQCYGGVPQYARGPAARIIGRARFREFGAASVVALGVALAVGEPIGLVVVVAAALTTVGLRVHAHRRIGGMTGRLLGASRELVETVLLVTLGILAGGLR
jgi:adenosylcobinamide-GDP ribazoletransferase